MDATRQLATNSIEMSAGALAALTVEKMHARSTDAPPAFSLWKESLTGRLHELVAALRDDDPHLFAEQVVWARLSCEAREVPVQQLRVSLECLREVLQEELDEPATPWVESFLEKALAELEAPASIPPTLLQVQTAAGRLTASYLGAILEGDRRKAADLVLASVQDGALTAREAYLQVLLPAQEEIGRMWLMNEAGIAEEHFVTSTTKIAMARLAALATIDEQHGKTVVTASVAGNAHDVAVQALGDLFELDGWRVVNLGADNPEQEIAQAVLDHSADLVALSVTLPAQRGTAMSTIQGLTQLDPRPRILVGGGALGRHDSWSRHGADATAGGLEDGVIRGRELVGLSPHSGS